jgi:hypothetical protein
LVQQQSFNETEFLEDMLHSVFILSKSCVTYWQITVIKNRCILVVTQVDLQLRRNEEKTDKNKTDLEHHYTLL